MGETATGKYIHHVTFSLYFFFSHCWLIKNTEARVLAENWPVIENIDFGAYLITPLTEHE